MVPKQIYLNLMVLVSIITLLSCGSARVGLNENEDDVYHSRRESRGKDVYVPEVDVDEIIKKNPTQYDTTQPVKQNPIYLESAVAGVASQNNTFSYKSNTTTIEQEPTNTYVFNTTNYNENADEFTEAERLRMQYGNVYDNFGWNNQNFYNPYLTWNWRTLTAPLFWGFGWNNQFGWFGGAGFGCGFNSFYDPFCFYQPWGFNPYWNNFGYCNNWYWATPVCNTSQNQAPVQQARRNNIFSSTPTQTNQRNPNTENGKMAPNTDRKPLPSNQAQLINENGKTIYVAPEQYRKATPRSYSTYQNSIDNEAATRAVTPAPPARNNSVPRTQPIQQSTVNPSRNNSDVINNTQRNRVPNTTNTYRNNSGDNNFNPNSNRAPQTGRTFTAPAPPAGSRGGGSTGNTGGGSRPVTRPR